MKLIGVKFANLSNKNKIALEMLLYDDYTEKYSSIEISRCENCNNSYSLATKYNTVSKKSAKIMKESKMFVKCNSPVTLKINESASLLTPNAINFSKDTFMSELNYFARVETNAFVIDSANNELLISENHISLSEKVFPERSNNWIII